MSRRREGPPLDQQARRAGYMHHGAHAVAIIKGVEQAPRAWDSIHAEPTCGKVTDIGGTNEKRLESAIERIPRHGQLMCSCWCGRGYVWLDPDDIGVRTESCGAHGCDGGRAF